MIRHLRRLPPSVREDWLLQCQLGARHPVAALVLVRTYRRATGRVVAVAAMQRACRAAAIALEKSRPK